MKTSTTNLTPCERMVLKVLKHAARALTQEEILTESGYSGATHLRGCLRFLVATKAVEIITSRKLNVSAYRLHTVATPVVTEE